MQVMCEACAENGVERVASVLAPQSLNQGKTGVYTAACPSHFADWWVDSDWLYDASDLTIPLPHKQQSAFDKDEFHDFVISHGFGPPTATDYVIGKQLYEVGCTCGLCSGEYYRGDYVRVAAEIVRRTNRRRTSDE